MSDSDPGVTVLPPTIKQAGDPRKDATWTMLPPSPDVCSQCACDHEPEIPHNQQSLHYQYAFYAEHDRWPTWADAMAHCDEETQRSWRAALRGHGVEVPDV